MEKEGISVEKPQKRRRELEREVSMGIEQAITESTSGREEKKLINHRPNAGGWVEEHYLGPSTRRVSGKFGFFPGPNGVGEGERKSLQAKKVRIALLQGVRAAVVTKGNRRRSISERGGKKDICVPWGSGAPG